MSTTLLDTIVTLKRTLARAAFAAFSGEVSARQTAVLREIRAAGPVSQVCLARATASDPSFIVRTLDDLEKRGLVTRQRSTTDRRERVVDLTPQGLEALGPLDVAYNRLADAVDQSLTTKERA
ncbi:MAG: MarR family transcriptional regulator, partial [bacterium]